MLSIRAEFLTGRYVAADPYKHDRPEWPPHPGRLFAAMASVYFEGHKNDYERSALEWLEGCKPPSISYKEKFQRETVRYFVPINDNKEYFTSGQVSLGTIELRGGRLHKDRTFPTTVAGFDPVTFVWDGVDASSHVQYLRTICSRVHRLGHSSSIVHLTVDENTRDVEPSLIPNTRGEYKIRWVSPGTLDQFEAAYHVEDADNRKEQTYFARKARLNAIILPSTPYTSQQDTPDRVATGQFSKMYVFRIANKPNPRLVHARAISKSVKSMLLGSKVDAESVSGLDVDGKPTTRPHISVVPLAFVGHRHADGRVLGIGIVIPHGLDKSTAEAILRSMQSADMEVSASRLDVQGHGVMELMPSEDNMITIDAATWEQRSKIWSSVTPIVLDRAPRARGDARDAEVSRIISKSCTVQGLPAPVSVTVANTPYLPGPPPSSAFPLYTLPRRNVMSEHGSAYGKPTDSANATNAKVHTHARITFSETVSGPLILGAGRYNGYGLFIPRDGES